jgi:hypothetical protein
MIIGDKEDSTETLLLTRMKTFLPEYLINEIAAFSGVVIKQRFLAKVEYLDKWIIENTGHIMSLIDTWTKPHVAFVLTRIMHLEKPVSNTAYLEGVGTLYDRFTKSEMAKAIKMHISYRVKNRRHEDLLEKDQMMKCVFPHYFVRCRVNPSLDEMEPARMYGAYKAIEEYDRRMREKKIK